MLQTKNITKERSNQYCGSFSDSCISLTNQRK